MRIKAESAKRGFTYLNNAATTFPKPPPVLKSMESAMKTLGQNPGRSGATIPANVDRFIYGARLAAADFFGAPDPARVIFTPGCTYSVNTAIRGLLGPGSHVITTGRLHNSIARTIYDPRMKLKVSELAWDGKQKLDAPFFKKHLIGKTKAIIVNHASNVDGLLFPLREIGKAAKTLGLPLIVDAAQTAGLVPIAIVKDGVSILCVSGHKGLMGPAGIGLLILSPGIDIEPLISGGTGSFSEEMDMPKKYPDRLESGSPNVIGIAGLAAGIEFLRKAGVEKIFKHEKALSDLAAQEIGKLPGVRVYRPASEASQMPLFSFNIDGHDPSGIAEYLKVKHGIVTRVGLHCAPRAHREIGTYPFGSVRVSVGYYTCWRDVKNFIGAIRAYCGKGRR